jgi:hypothetical protein
MTLPVPKKAIMAAATSLISRSSQLSISKCLRIPDGVDDSLDTQLCFRMPRLLDGLPAVKTSLTNLAPTCMACGCVMPWSAFVARMRTPAGLEQRTVSYCAACAQADLDFAADLRLTNGHSRATT